MTKQPWFKAIFQGGSSSFKDLLIISIFSLFLELYLIRWISTEIRIFAYFNNLVLLACFIGLGLGLALASRRTNILYTFVMIAILVMAGNTEAFLDITNILSSASDAVIWKETTQDTLFLAFKGTVLTLFLFVFIAIAFIPPGQILGRLFKSHRNIIWAYSINVLGSMIGVWLFASISYLFLPPWSWFLLSVVLGVRFLEINTRNVVSIAALSLLTLLLIIQTDNYVEKIWSPYQKLDLRVSHTFLGGVSQENGYYVNVNNYGYMCIRDMSEEFARAHFSSDLADQRKYNQYELPYLFHDDAKQVLIVGVGGGNGPAGALRLNIPSIDAVEIDPGIYKMGLLYHPEKPYQHKNVNIIIDDARSYFKKCEKKYDVISLGLLDSHSTASSYNNTRLDDYVYTLDSFQDAKRILKDDGILTLIFEVKQPFIATRLYKLLQATFHMNPLVFLVRSPGFAFGPGGVMFVVGNDKFDMAKVLTQKQELFQYISDRRYPIKDINTVTITTDDWPYLYLKERHIPQMYLLVLISLLILIFPMNHILKTEGKPLQLHFFFLGAAFLLLEFQNISKASLLFGATWIVNVYMISAILMLILLANWTMHVLTIRRNEILYYILFGSIVILYFLPPSLFSGYQMVFKSTILALLLNIPIFFAGLIFIYSFSRCKNKELAFGSNLLGAAMGGLFESMSFIIGIKSLLLVVLVFYLFSFLYRQRETSLVAER